MSPSDDPSARFFSLSLSLIRNIFDDAIIHLTSAPRRRTSSSLATLIHRIAFGISSIASHFVASILIFIPSSDGYNSVVLFSRSDDVISKTVPFRICADGSCGWRNWPVAPRASRTRRCHRTIPFCLWSPASTGRTSPVCQSHLSVSPCFVFFCFFCTRYQFSAMLLGSLTIPIDQLPSLHC